MRAYTGGGPDLIWYGAAATVSRRRSPGSGSWTATAGSWSATTTAATSLRLRARRRPAVPRPYAPVPRGRLRDRPAIPGLDPAAGRRRAPRGRRAAGVARAAGQASLDPTLLAAPRHSYDQTVARGISVNLSRPWHKGNHPGLVLARRLKRTAAQVWLFAARLDIPATSNGSENASLLNLYAAGRLKLDELITRRYGPDDVSQAYADMRSGVNIRGVVDFIPAG
jgi:hypothetical protein